VPSCRTRRHSVVLSAVQNGPYGSDELSELNLQGLLHSKDKQKSLNPGTVPASKQIKSGTKQCTCLLEIDFNLVSDRIEPLSAPSAATNELESAFIVAADHPLICTAMCHESMKTARSVWFVRPSARGPVWST
jgi:hypothetical protein